MVQQELNHKHSDLLNFRPLPFVEQLKEINQQEDEGLEHSMAVKAAIEELVSRPGWQLVLELMRDITLIAHTNIANGDRVEFFSGHLSALEALKSSLREHLSEISFSDEQDEGLVQEEV